MPYSRSYSYDVESESDFEKCHDHCRMHDPCRPRIEMFIDDNDRVRNEADTDDNDWRQEDMANENYNHEYEQTHVHEVLGSVEIAEPQEDPHNHRFATVSGQAIPCGRNDHYHEVRFRTDFYEDHFHEACVRTGGAIWTGDRHVHFLMGTTTVVDGHDHDFRAATLIDDPIGE